MLRACLRVVAVSVALLAVSAAVGCNNDDDSSDRKCGDSLPAYTKPANGASCATAQTVALSYCERLSGPHCPTGTPPGYACISDENGNGMIVVLSPCGTVDSLPLSASFGDDHFVAGPNALADCQAAANTCDAGMLTGVVGLDVPSGAGAD